VHLTLKFIGRGPTRKKSKRIKESTAIAPHKKSTPPIPFEIKFRGVGILLPPEMSGAPKRLSWARSQKVGEELGGALPPLPWKTSPSAPAVLAIRGGSSGAFFYIHPHLTLAGRVLIKSIDRLRALKSSAWKH